jgi:hypothetical protein
MALIKTSAQGLTADATNFVLLHTAESGTNVSEIDFSSYVSSSYDEYILYFASLPTNDGVGLRLRMRSAGSFVSSSIYGNSATRIDSTSRSIHTTDGGNRFEICGNGTQGNGSDETLQSIIKFTNMNSTNFATSCFWESSFDATSGNHVNFYGSGSLTTKATVCDGFKLFYGAGDFNEYEYRLYGVKN